MLVIAQPPDHKKTKWRILAGAEKKNRSFMVIKWIAIDFLPAKQVGLEVNTSIRDVMGSQNS